MGVIERASQGADAGQPPRRIVAVALTPGRPVGRLYAQARSQSIGVGVIHCVIGPRGRLPCHSFSGGGSFSKGSSSLNSVACLP